MYNKTIIRFVFVISRITKVSVRVISLSLDITKTSSNNCFFMYVAKISGARFAQHVLLALPLKRKRIRVIHVPSSNFSNKRLTQNQHFLSYPPLHFICILEFSVVTRSKTMVFSRQSVPFRSFTQLILGVSFFFCLHVFTCRMSLQPEGTVCDV